jgi:hypothetical protein
VITLHSSFTAIRTIDFSNPFPVILSRSPKACFWAQAELAVRKSDFSHSNQLLSKPRHRQADALQVNGVQKLAFGRKRSLREEKVTSLIRINVHQSPSIGKPMHSKLTESKSLLLGASGACGKKK